MATEKTLEILKKMKADPKAKELFDGMEKPKSPDEAISAYAQVAEKLGYGITAQDIKEAIEQEEASRKAKTDKVVSDMEALEDDDLEGVAGGYYYEDGCADTFSVFSSCEKVDYCFFEISYYECYNDYWCV
jgi:hypothetical protein